MILQLFLITWETKDLGIIQHIAKTNNKTNGMSIMIVMLLKFKMLKTPLFPIMLIYYFMKEEIEINLYIH